MSRTTEDEVLLLFGERCLFVDSDVEQDGRDADGSAGKHAGRQCGEHAVSQLQSDGVCIPSHTADVFNIRVWYSKQVK